MDYCNRKRWNTEARWQVCFQPGIEQGIQTQQCHFDQVDRHKRSRWTARRSNRMCHLSSDKTECRRQDPQEGCCSPRRESTSVHRETALWAGGVLAQRCSRSGIGYGVPSLQPTRALRARIRWLAGSLRNIAATALAVSVDRRELLRALRRATDLLLS